MAFHYQPIVGGELFEASERFAKDIDGRAVSPQNEWAATLENVWDQIQALGWPLSLVPEQSGGTGGTLEDALALIEGAARFALPMPLTKSLLVTPRLYEKAGLQQIVSGEVRPTPLLDAVYPWAGAFPVGAMLEISGERVSGQILGTEVVPGSTHFLIAGNHDILLVPASQVQLRAHQRIDGRLAADLVFEAAEIHSRHAGGAIQEVLDLAALSCCVEIVAGAATVIEDTVRYLDARRQFGVPLSSFQVLRHSVADMYVAYQNAHALTSAAVRASIASPDILPQRDIAMAKLRAGEVGRLIAETSIQLHGGMGMTQENRPTRIGKRLILADLEWGDRAWQADRLLASQELAA